MGYDVAFAKRCFPARASLIDELAARDGSFRDLCYDFATAEEVRLTWETASGPERDERHAECVELLDGLGPRSRRRSITRLSCRFTVGGDEEPKPNKPLPYLG